MKKQKIKHLSLRIDEALLGKFRYICAYDARSINGQLLNYIRNTVREFEQKHEEINKDDLFLKK